MLSIEFFPSKNMLVSLCLLTFQLDQVTNQRNFNMNSTRNRGHYIQRFEEQEKKKKSLSAECIIIRHGLQH